MRSLRKIIRPGSIIPLDEVVKIPDAPAISQTNAVAEEAQAEDPQDQTSSYVSPLNVLSDNTVERANEISQKILQRARTERESILEQAQADAQRIREEAGREAYCKVLEDKQNEIDSCLSELERLMNELQEQQRSFLKQYEEGLHILALDITKKVLGTSIREHEELMLPLIKNAIASVKNADWISIQISERLPQLVEQLKKELAHRQDLGRVEVAASDLPEDSCIISVSEGVVDASVSVQLENLRAQFEKDT